MGKFLGKAAAAAVLLGTASPAAGAGAEPRIALSTSPEVVCLDGRSTAQLNFDVVVKNTTGRALAVLELRAVVLNPQGEMVERRLIWQDALGLLGPNRTVAAGGDGLLFNPFAFRTLKPGWAVRYEIDFEGETTPASLMVRPVSCETQARLILPLSGRVLVYDGYDFLSHHRRQSYQLQTDMKAFGVVDNWYRFALDLVPVDAKGALFRGEGGRMADWFGWGTPVRAAGAGVVAAVRDSQPDNDVVGTENRRVSKKLSEDEMESNGNYVLIDHGGGELSLASHLRQGSARVKTGDKVKAGQVIAAVGASGSAPVPHLHYELRNRWGVRGVRGLPPYFNDLKVLGTGEGRRPVALNTGDVVVAR